MIYDTTDTLASQDFDDVYLASLPEGTTFVRCLTAYYQSLPDQLVAVRLGQALEAGSLETGKKANMDCDTWQIQDGVLTMTHSGYISVEAAKKMFEEYQLPSWKVSCCQITPSGMQYGYESHLEVRAADEQAAVAKAKRYHPNSSRHKAARLPVMALLLLAAIAAFLTSCSDDDNSSSSLVSHLDSIGTTFDDLGYTGGIHSNIPWGIYDIVAEKCYRGIPDSLRQSFDDEFVPYSFDWISKDEVGRRLDELSADEKLMAEDYFECIASKLEGG